MADKEKPVAVFAPSIRSIKVYESGRIVYQGKTGSITGADARVESSGAQRGLRDTRRVVLIIEGPEVAISAALPAAALRVHQDARKFAATINEMSLRLAGLAPGVGAAPDAGRRPDARHDPDTGPAVVGGPDPAQTESSPPTSPPTADLLDYLERLGRLRDSGVLTEDEFQAQKARLLRSTEP